MNGHEATISPFVSKVALIPIEVTLNEYNELNDQNEQNENNECVECVLRKELVADGSATLYSMIRTRRTNITNETNGWVATSVFTSMSETNNWF